VKVDSTFHIGQAHINHVSPCQDFADHSLDANSAFVVVSDGCSTGGQTDIGARLIARHAIKDYRSGTLRANGSDQNFIEAGKLDFDLENLSLTHRDLFATALTVEWNPLFEGKLRVAGDGVVACMYDTTTILYRFEWANNTPFYPIYFSPSGQASGLAKSFIDIHKDNPHPFLCTSVTITEGMVEEQWPMTLTEGAAFQVWNVHILHCQMQEKLKGIALFSDGITQITNAAGETLDWIAAVQTCLAFKNSTGDFVKRRVRRAIQDWARHGYVPQDDLSMAVILNE